MPGRVFNIDKGTKVVLMITFLVSVLAIITAMVYYTTINKAQDPRVRQARGILARYDTMPLQSDLTSKLELLDSAYSVFRAFPDYERSFEAGVILNNKASAFLVAALYDTSVTTSEKDILLGLAMIYADSSIAVYNSWIKDWGDLSSDEIEKRIKLLMLPADPAFSGMKYNRLIERRVKNQLSAQVETPRRISVCMSNKGIIYRHMHMPDSAVLYLQESLKLWENNRVARSNLSVLMGGKPVKAGIIESLFPPDRNKRD